MSKKRRYFLGEIGGIRVEALPSALGGTLALWAVFSGLARRLVGAPVGLSLLLGAGATALHWFGDLAHQLGHYRAGRAVGYPLNLLRMQGVLLGSRYPRDEPPLPPEIHIKRALGGAPVSLLLAFLGWSGLRVVPENRVGTRFLLGVWTAENLLVFGLGAFLPISWLDGGALLYWTRKQREAREERDE